MKQTLFLTAVITVVYIVMIYNSQGIVFATTSSQDTDLDIEVNHGGSGAIELCFESEDHTSPCGEFNLAEESNPFIQPIGVEDPDEGDSFEVCYEVKGKDVKGCNEYEFNGDDSQTVEITIPGTGDSIGGDSSPGGGPAVPPLQRSFNNDSTGSSSGIRGGGQPAIPPSPPQQDQQITWKTFTGRNGLFTVQYPSNWTPGPSQQPVSDTDIQFDYFENVQNYGALNIYKFDVPSVFASSNASLDSVLSTDRNSQAGFVLDRPIECGTYTLNGVSACSYVAFFTDVDGVNAKSLMLRAVDTDGTEYGANFAASTNLFDHFLPVVGNMIKSFKVT